MYTTLKETMHYIKCDAYRYLGHNKILNMVKLYLVNICFRYTAWNRITYYLSQKKIYIPLYIVSKLRLVLLTRLAGIQIPIRTQIGKGLYIGHGMCIVVNPDTIIGCNVNLSQGVTLGQANRGCRIGAPKIGNNVYIGPGVKIIGSVNIGNNVAIGANAVVTKDIPDNAVVVGIPAKIISFDGVEGYIENAC